eukprot:2172260-Pyramimonas_sp.AAC.1
MVVQGPTASFSYGTNAQLRRSAATAMGKHWSGRRRRTYLDLEQADPAVSILRRQPSSWFDTWCHRLDLHEEAC